MIVGHPGVAQVAVLGRRGVRAPGRRLPRPAWASVRIRASGLGPLRRGDIPSRPIAHTATRTPPSCSSGTGAS